MLDAASKVVRHGTPKRRVPRAPEVAQSEDAQHCEQHERRDDRQQQRAEAAEPVGEEQEHALAATRSGARDAVLLEVLEVERPHELGDLAAA